MFWKINVFFFLKTWKNSFKYWVGKVVKKNRFKPVKPSPTGLIEKKPGCFETLPKVRKSQIFVFQLFDQFDGKTRQSGFQI